MNMKERKEKHFLKKPIYEGGKEALQDFIKNNLKYPKEALENKIEGVVIVRYTIDKSGKVVKTKIKTGLGYGCDEEAQRVVKLLKFVVPRNRKLKVLFHKTIHIRFTLPKKRPGKTGMQVSYTNSDKKNKEEEENPQKNSYNYSITIGE
jgi:TonB family protein